jgi:hypothetical protein
VELLLKREPTYPKNDGLVIFALGQVLPKVETTGVNLEKIGQ